MNTENFCTIHPDNGGEPFTINKAQFDALNRKFLQNPDGSPNFFMFRKRARQGFDCLMINWCGISSNMKMKNSKAWMNTCQKGNKMASLYANKKLGNMNGWQERHNKAVQDALSARLSDNPFAKSIVLQLSSWSMYALAYKAKYDSLIIDDSFLGSYWLDTGKNIRAMLNEETGTLDSGTLDAFILDTMSENGVDLDKEGL